VRALVQRVNGARVLVDGAVVGDITGPGLLVLVGVTHTDTAEIAAALAGKVYRLRIFDIRDFPLCPAPSATVEVAASDLNLPVLVISQFTLYANTTKGRRPTWDAAAKGHVAEPIVAEFCQALRALGAQVAEGVFGADMHVELVNDGPMTLMLELDA
jgi:D-aminoacyl-tRNA deacylase